MSEHLSQVETPSLILDLDRLDRNLARMGAQLAPWPKVAFRPHMKTAKCVDVARRALPQGGPIMVSTLHEAEYFFGHGFDDILYGVGVSPDKLPRIARLAGRGAKITVILDSVAMAEALCGFLAAGGPPITVLIEIDTDGHRSGVRPDAPELLEIGAVLSGAGALGGVLTHAGESYQARSLEDLHAYAELERSGAVQAAERLRSAGWAAPVVSVGSTPTALFAQDLTGVTEVRAGVFMFQDLVMAGVGVCSPNDIALSVLTTVIGHQASRNWIITDAGWMAMSRDRGTERQAVDQGYGLVCDMAGAPIGDLIMVSANQEHGVIADRAGAGLDLSAFPIGSRLRILPNHACATGAQHGAYTVVRGEEILDRWTRERGW
ncbi:alanine racemase [Phenylobacterium sp.]|uniref:alanine racemase n=1 Tax=Phenylobacterium sp. TaxID=1871053 RepID=UPI002730136E|nr:alanine racemase [Phenylobacterium sp.]MDP1618064.1 alanine racemase [Phenylobacterium sp.]MDP1987291.1 alanine racemase [Phenylobacterium sp.]